MNEDKTQDIETTPADAEATDPVSMTERDQTVVDETVLDETVSDDAVSDDAGDPADEAVPVDEVEPVVDEAVPGDKSAPTDGVEPDVVAGEAVTEQIDLRPAASTDVPAEPVTTEMAPTEMATVEPVEAGIAHAETTEPETTELPAAALPPSAGPVDETAEPEESGGRPKYLVPLLAGAGVLVVLGGLYAVDVLTTRGEIPRGTVVEGVEVGGMEPAAAETALRDSLDGPVTTPLPVRAGDVETTIDPAAAGLVLDWPATLDDAGSPPLNPWNRLTSLFTDRDVEVVTSVDENALRGAVEGLRKETDRTKVDGALGFDGATPAPVAPVDGQSVRVDDAVVAVEDGWLTGGPVELPVDARPAEVEQAAVDEAVGRAEAAVAAPYVITGRDGVTATLAPKDIAARLTFAPEAGTLATKFDVDSAVKALAPQLAGTELENKDASVRLGGAGPEVVPAIDGRVVDWAKTLTKDPVALLTGPERSTKAVYSEKKAEFSTADAQGLGIREVIGEFTTSDFSQPSGVNIRRVAEEVQGAVVRPGDTFSLNGYTGTRGTAQGYVASGIIKDGKPDEAVGGGISQFATTLYNAGYFAGMQDVEHQEHSYFISRYPEAREATVFEGAIDLQFSVPTKTGVLIQTIGTGSSITVRIWGTKTVDVESITGARSAFTSPETITLPEGEDCAASEGGEGFTAQDTRVIRNAGSGAEISRTTNVAVYNPQPKVVCEKPE